MMSAAARFHDDQAHGTVGEPALELRAGEALFVDDAPSGIGDGELEGGLCKIHPSQQCLRGDRFRGENRLVRLRMAAYDERLAGRPKAPAAGNARDLARGIRAVASGTDQSCIRPSVDPVKRGVVSSVEEVRRR